MEKTAKPTNSKFDQAFSKAWVRILVGLSCLGLAYVFASWAIDSGSLLDYAITLMLLVIGVRELLTSIGSKRR